MGAGHSFTLLSRAEMEASPLTVEGEMGRQ
jgi:hypothetical protein